MVFISPSGDFQERLCILRDDASGLSGVIAIHSTALGPAAGGCRLGNYASEEALQSAAIGLARCMSFKAAMAGLPFGGGKAILQTPKGAIDRARLFRAFGEAVKNLRGDYITAADVGSTTADMQIVSETTRFVAGLPCAHEAPDSDPSSLTALGVFEAMQSASRLILEQELGDLTIAVQGVGNVGARLCGLLQASGARLVITDINWDRAEHMAHRFGARLVAPEDIGSVEADIFAPCAIGGTLDAPLIDSLRVGLVCGGADNQLASRADGFRLADRGIVYSPDYAVNSGGIIGVAGAYLGQSESEVAARVRKIGPRIVTVLKQARLERRPPEFVADAIASDIIAAAARRAA